MENIQSFEEMIALTITFVAGYLTRKMRAWFKRKAGQND